MTRHLSAPEVEQAQRERILAKVRKPNTAHGTWVGVFPLTDGDQIGAMVREGLLTQVARTAPSAGGGPVRTLHYLKPGPKAARR